jgi:hypothetical protein
MVGALGSNQTAKGATSLVFDANVGALTSNYHISAVSNIAAAGTALANAAAITKSMVYVNACLNGANAVRLPSITAGMSIFITNGSANTLNVFPPANAQINTNGANTVYSQLAGSTLIYIAPIANQWYTAGATYM